ncbi:UDP-glucose dehydrogenase [Arboricoccus pini]|uniref:UDP-glucose 6-dehydrogenase n=1 Tax=Arboricoccus pini TaxID=1963835 RepID=A0A212R3T5_9PROT|nr:UDP-glucose/GDP-mannose dehydrogenase family protein [Arboricoccus pini]SNB66488.1 UDP-glucose dehydrogenase [Arboricoccus pini]
MRIVMIGAGYVGLVSAACFAEFGIEVVCVDKDRHRIEALRAGRMPIFEPGLEDLVKRHVASGRLGFTFNLKSALQGAMAAFIAVGTPSRRGDGHADLSHVFAAAGEIATALSHPLLVVTKSTVPVGTGRRLAAFFAETRPDLKIEVAANPEFLREGAAIEDFMRPDRIVCGIDGSGAQALLEALYRPLAQAGTPLLFTGRETAELIKYAANSYLATKITFINEMADLCEATGADIEVVAKGMGLDGRIGGRFLKPGPGYGGSCFPKDVQALLHTAREQSVPLRIVEAVEAANAARKLKMVSRIVAACDGKVRGKRIGVLGVTFKSGTDDVRDSPSLVVLPALQELGAKLCVFDPAGMEEARKRLPGLTWAQNAYETAQDATALVILTEWEAFGSLDLDQLKTLMHTPVIIDLRNVLSPAAARARGFAYHSIGRPKARI